jgi:amino acid transporter
MAEQPTDFREQLLDAQPISPALRDEYRKALADLRHHKLTPRTRLITWLMFLGCAVGGIICAVATWVHRANIDSLITLPVFTGVSIAAAVWLGRVLRAGQYEHRASFTVIERLGGLASGVFVAVVLFRGMNHPAEPTSIFGAIMAVMLVMVGFAWGTGNRIAAATLETREHLLRLESRLADLAERLPKR